MSPGMLAWCSTPTFNITWVRSGRCSRRSPWGMGTPGSSGTSALLYRPSTWTRGLWRWGPVGLRPQRMAAVAAMRLARAVPPRIVQRIEGVPAGVLVAGAGLHAWGTEARARLGLETMRDAGELWGDKAQAVAHQGWDCMASGHKRQCRGLPRRVSHDLRDAECGKPPRAPPPVISHLRAVRWRLGREGRAVRLSPRRLLCSGAWIDTSK